MTEVKIKSKKGFTLVEMLCAVIVLLLITSLMAVGVQLAVRSLRTLVMDSESQVLCSTIRASVSDELRYSGTTTVSGGNISFFSQNYGEGVEYSTNEDGQILLGGNKILSSKSYTYDMRASVTLKSYDSTSKIFSVSVKVTDSDGNLLASSDFQVQRLNS